MYFLNLHTPFLHPWYTNTVITKPSVLNESLNAHVAKAERPLDVPLRSLRVGAADVQYLRFIQDTV